MIGVDGGLSVAAGGRSTCFTAPQGGRQPTSIAQLCGGWWRLAGDCSVCCGAVASAILCFDRHLPPNDKSCLFWHGYKPLFRCPFGPSWRTPTPGSQLAAGSGQLSGCPASFCSPSRSPSSPTSPTNRLCPHLYPALPTGAAINQTHEPDLLPISLQVISLLVHR